MEPKFDNLDELIFSSKEEVRINPNYNDILLNKLNAEISEENNKKYSLWNLFDRTAGLSFTMTGLLFMLINIFGLNYQCMEFFFKLKEIYLLIGYK